jgi:hypothetical protein
LEVAPDDLVEPNPARFGLIGFHLHNYAAFLSWHADSDIDLRAAVHLFREWVLPARELFFARGGGFEPLRHTLQVATRATCALATSAVSAGDPDAGRAWAAHGLEWIRRALADPSTTALLSGVTEPACRLALLAAPALLLAVDLDVPGSGPADVRTAAEMMLLARRWEQRSVGDDLDSHARHAEVVELERRVEKLLGERRTS